MTSSTTLSPSEAKCQSKKSHGFDWPAAKINELSKVQCPDNWEGSGGTWNCSKNGEFEGQPKIDCTSKWLNEMKQTIKKTSDIKSLDKVSHELSENITSPLNGIKYPGDLSTTAEVVKVIQHRTDYFVNHLPPKDFELSVKNITYSVVKTCSRMLAHEAAWNSTEPTDAVDIAASVLRYIQYAGFTLGCSEAAMNANMKKESVKEKHEHSNIFMSAFNMDHQQPISFNFNGQKFSLTNHIESDFPVSGMCQHKIGVGAVFDKLSKYLSFSMSQNDLLINSEIVAFNYNNISTYLLPNSTYARMKYVYYVNNFRHNKLIFPG